jgi:hypothetical protein
MFARCRNSAGVCLLLALAGCSDKDITAYRVPKDPGAAAPSAPAEISAGGAEPALHWATPAGWQAQAASGLRAASFLAPGQGSGSADVSVVAFGGAGGDPLANINRWRGQLQLAPITAERLPSEVSSLDAPAGHFLVADIHGEPSRGKAPTRILGAWLEQPGRVWFFKMMGPEDVVESQRDAFIGFLRSVAPGTPVEGPPQVVQEGARRAGNTNDLPHAGFVVAPAAAAGQPSLHWQAPPDWEPKSATAMRKGSYAIKRDGAVADLSITAFPGDVGGMAANVNRWRGQVGLPPVDDSAVGALTETFDANGLHFTLVDFAGPTSPGRQRLVVGVVSWQGASWFFKLTGPDGLVENEKPAFVAFLKSVQAK